MTPEQINILKLIALATDRGESAQAETKEERAATDRLFDLGYIRITPPGWCFKINDSGREALAKLEQKAA